jgi:predicted NodU family carbamoyl transferase
MQSRELVVGLNKYSHDASCCIVDMEGNVLFTQAKERISRKKHDGGSVGDLVDYALDAIGAKTEDIVAVVSNNHHHRVLPFESEFEFMDSLGYLPNKKYMEPSNLLKHAKQFELSHHLAHAWSVVGMTPFDADEGGLIVCMDGMGETYKAMVEDVSGAETNSGDYMHDIKLIRGYADQPFVGQPRVLLPGTEYREAESAYIFNGTALVPVFKRWSRQRFPPQVYNEGFEYMESLGAIYSR